MQALVSEPVKPMMPCVVMSNTIHAYMSQSDKGELVIGAGTDAYMSYSQTGGLHIANHTLEAICELFPAVRRMRMLRNWGGIVDVTPDRSPIIGEDAGSGAVRQLRLGHRRLQGDAGLGPCVRAHDRPRRAASARRALHASTAFAPAGSSTKPPPRRSRIEPAMLLIDCPYCGMARPEIEFAYGGEAHIARRRRSERALSDEEWANFLYFRSNPKGVLAERWRHAHGCGRFFNCLRDTLSDKILAVYKAGEPRPDAPSERAGPARMSQPFRLAGVGSIDRSRPLVFTFDGLDYQGYAGDTLASALIANGVHLIGRSFKYHRPRGILYRRRRGAERACQPSTRGPGRVTPNLRATQIELYDGLNASSQNRWPSLTFDLGAVNDLFSPLFGAGFYYKTFMGPNLFGKNWAWTRVYEPMIRRAAGLGVPPREPDPDRYQRTFDHCDVLIVGAGPAGLAAALAASQSGARVVVCDENPALGRLAPRRD